MAEKNTKGITGPKGTSAGGGDVGMSADSQTDTSRDEFLEAMEAEEEEVKSFSESDFVDVFADTITVKVELANQIRKVTVVMADQLFRDMLKDDNPPDLIVAQEECVKEVRNQGMDAVTKARQEFLDALSPEEREFIREYTDKQNDQLLLHGFTDPDFNKLSLDKVPRYVKEALLNTWHDVNDTMTLFDRSFRGQGRTQ